MDMIMDGSMDEKKGKKLGMAQTNLTLCEAEVSHSHHVTLNGLGWCNAMLHSKNSYCPLFYCIFIA